MGGFGLIVLIKKILKTEFNRLFPMIILMQEHVLSGGHGLMVQGYHPVIKALAKDIDIRLNHRYNACMKKLRFPYLYILPFLLI